VADLGTLARTRAGRLLGRLNPGAPPAGDRDRTGQGVEEVEDHAEQLDHDRKPKSGCKAGNRSRIDT
jgi:hypothetical protein